MSGNSNNSVAGYGGASQTQAARADAVKDIVKIQRGLLFERPGERVSLNDLNEVVTVARRYICICEERGLIPSFSGLAVLCGCSRQALYKVLTERPDSPVGIFLEQCRTAFTASRISAADRGAAGEPLTIFLLKNSYQNFVDRHEFAPAEPSSPFEKKTDEELMNVYLSDIPEE